MSSNFSFLVLIAMGMAFCSPILRGADVPYPGIATSNATDIAVIAGGAPATATLGQTKIGGGQIWSSGPDGSSNVGVLRLGTTDNRTNTTAQIVGTLAVWAPYANSSSDMFAADVNYYNNGSSPTWAGAGLRWHGQNVTGTFVNTSIPLARSAVVVGQNCDQLVIGTNGMGPVHFVNVNGAMMTIMPSGNIGIGTQSPTNKLTVIGTISAKEVKVTTTGADYVFEEGYHLLSLSEVEEFIQANRHLPGIVPASKMQAEGLAVSELVTKQLEKIEELTLHAIAAEKRQDILAEENHRLAARIKLLEASHAEILQRMNAFEARTAEKK